MPIMSLLKTLQSTPATITIFHNSKIPLSNKLFRILQSAAHRQSHTPNTPFAAVPVPKFEINVMKDQMPTYDQYLHFLNQCNHDKASLHDSYPFLKGRKKHYYETSHSGHSVTIRGVDMDRIFTEEEYEMIYDAFNKIQELGDNIRDVTPADVFKAPLVVDWDQNKLAHDEATLKTMLAKYVPESEHYSGSGTGIAMDAQPVVN
ncbi:uncharacterized protein SPAPADRAFT_52711 [Spathaspora passalidarum NRRL Y-27907]|uniref:Uncharacterized protein n=1 Tax=Spathaspora passalidarum (strain NRRL Y-27907 / 11-Y1) TaxID=619300 RepID=G3AUZ3_SPAPN|nr:uncharacterized protein SPAPADRAFT_52711 [Spathaspora passalidarum NRRL Y-27907]EGW29850.1 hypothetical protein SPAPADRAFT_52711 [Spathaspora passalidarum NRRL Y-27907]